MTVRRTCRAFAVAAMTALLSGPVAAQPTSSLTGDATYRLYCATCHGTRGKGDGPLAATLKQRPPDLTLLAARNNAVFPADLVAQIIDGRKPARGHGGGDMPVWGDAFSRSDERTPVAERINRLVRFLERLQGE